MYYNDHSNHSELTLLDTHRPAATPPASVHGDTGNVRMHQGLGPISQQGLQSFTRSLSAGSGGVMPVAHAEAYQRRAVTYASGQLAYIQSDRCTVIGNQVMTLSAATEVFLNALAQWRRNGLGMRELMVAGKVANAILDGIPRAMQPEIHFAALDELARDLPDPQDPDRVYRSLALTRDRVTRFHPETSGLMNSKILQLIPAAYFVSRYVELLSGGGPEASRLHEEAVQRFNGPFSDFDETFGDGTSEIRTDLATDLTAEPSDLVLPEAETVIGSATAPNTRGRGTEPQGHVLPPPQDSCLIDASHFGADDFVIQHAAVGNANPYTRINIATITALQPQPNYSAMLRTVKEVIAALPVDQNNPLVKYRHQREQLIHAAFASIHNRNAQGDGGPITSWIGNEASGRLAREVRRLVAPKLKSEWADFGHRANIPTGWRDRVTQHNFDSREVISDAMRLEISLQALNMPLGKTARKDVLAAVSHWLDECSRNYTRSPNEYGQALFSLAATLENRPPTFGEANCLLLKKILKTQLQNLTLATTDTILPRLDLAVANLHLVRVHEKIRSALAS